MIRKEDYKLQKYMLDDESDVPDDKPEFDIENLQDAEA
jgi:hypothetical protein